MTIAALEIRDLRKTYHNGVDALKGINLTVQAGDFFALLGANGAGKSTTIGLITTLLSKTSGSIHIQGYSLDTQASLAKACMGVVPQEINLNIFETCRQILLNQAGFYGLTREKAAARADELLKELALWDKRNTLARHLSGGMKRRLMIARALIHEPSILILDEPTAGVDIEIRHSLWEFLTRTNKAGTTIILTTHYLEEAERLCNRVAILNQGRLVTDTAMKQLLADLHRQTLVFTTQQPLMSLPPLTPYQATRIDATTFELKIDNQTCLNDVFAQLTQQGILIQHVHQKTNRLEEHFLDIIHDNE